MASKKQVDLARSFPLEQRANSVDEASARADQVRRNVQKPPLDRDEALKPFGCEAPAAFWVAAPSSASGAWCINKYDVRLPAPILEFIELIGRIQKPRFDCSTRSSGARRKLGKPGAVAVGCEDLCTRCRSSERKRLAARSCAQIEDFVAALWIACERDQLTALVLNFDKPGLEGWMIVDPAIDRQSNTQGADRRWNSARKFSQHGVARGFRGIDAKIQRRTLKQRWPFVRRKDRRKLEDQPFRHDSSKRRLLVRLHWLRTARVTEQLQQCRIVPGHADRRCASACRQFCRTPDGAEHQLAHRAPVFRSCVSSHFEIAGHDRVGRRAILARCDDYLVEDFDGRLQPSGWKS